MRNISNDAVLQKLPAMAEVFITKCGGTLKKERGEPSKVQISLKTLTFQTTTGCFPALELGDPRHFDGNSSLLLIERSDGFKLDILRGEANHSAPATPWVSSWLTESEGTFLL